MKILVISDTHGKHDLLRKVINKEKPFDLLLHAGDVEGGEDLIKELAGCERDGVYHFGLIYEESVFAVFEGAMEAQTIWQMIQDIAGR